MEGGENIDDIDIELLSLPTKQTQCPNNKAELNNTNDNQTDWTGRSNILVAVRLRPLLGHDRDAEETVRQIENKVIIIRDPGKSNDVIGQMRNRNREKQYAFDYVFDPSDNQKKVYENTTQFLIDGILQGYNATVFAYGCTGAGKTYTMLGTPENPGIMALTLDDLFSNIQKANINNETNIEYKVNVSFMEVYNENIRDLLVSSTKSLDLREGPDKGPTIAGITEIETKSSVQVMKLLHEGNKRRSQEATAANAVSSRSHAVLQVIVTKYDKSSASNIKYGKLSMIDLAGSERAANTKNRGKRLVEGANINRSLLALGNCINALGEKGKKSSFVPYRDSKLTRLLKDSLGGNCRTVMIANVSMAKSSFEETLNTLKYANRAKNIKTTVRRNVLKVNYHISEYHSLIDGLKSEVNNLKGKLHNDGGTNGGGRYTSKKTFDNSSRKAKLKAQICKQKPSDESNPNNNHREETMEEDTTLKEARAQVIQNFRERMKLRRHLVELENQNVSSSVEVGKLQLMLTEYERQKDQGNENEDESQDLSMLSDQIQESKKKIRRLKQIINQNLDLKKQLSFRLSVNEREIEKCRQRVVNDLNSEERRELMQMEYRIGKLELDKMELEQARNIHDSLMRGKDLSIEKLQLEIQIRNKIIKQQQHVLQENDLNEAVNYGILNNLEDASLSNGFESLRLSMNRMRTPPCTNPTAYVKNPSSKITTNDDPASTNDFNTDFFSDHESDQSFSPNKNSIDHLVQEEPTGIEIDEFPSIDTQRNPKPPPRRRTTINPRHFSEYASKASKIKSLKTSKEWMNALHNDSLPHIRINKSSHLLNTASPYLQNIKQRRQKHRSSLSGRNGVRSFQL